MDTPTRDFKPALELLTTENMNLKTDVEKLKTGLATVTAELAWLKMAVTIDMSKLQSFLDFSFKTFAESLKCDMKLCAEGRQLVGKVGRLVGILFTLGGIRGGKSVGDNTDVISPNFDIVCIVNGQTPPFKEVIDAIYEILFQYKKELKIQFGSLKKNGAFSLKFAFLNGIEVDLYLVTECNLNLPFEEIRRKMLANKEESWHYNGSLVETTVVFTEAQNSFTHIVARLGRFWFKSCHFGEEVNGGNTMIDLISVAAAMKELQIPVKSELRALIQIIEMVQNIDRIKIAFKKNSYGKWELIPLEILDKGNVSFERRGICSEHILKRNYYLIEPTNPLNDLLQDKSPGLIAKMKKYAEVTKQRLDALIKDKYTNLDNAGEKFVEFEKIFEPQPSDLREVFRSGFPSHVNLYMYSPYDFSYPEVVFNNETLLERAEVTDLLDAIKRNIIWTVNASQRWSPGFPAGIFRGYPCQEQSPNDVVYSSVKNLVYTNLLIESTSDFENDNWDVVIKVPFRTKWGIQAVCLGLMWN